MDDAPAVSTERLHVFIGGLHRSGTSLLHNVLRSHPEISGFTNTGVPEDEGQHLQTVYPRGVEFGGPGRFGFDPRAYMDETHPLATAAAAIALAEQWGRHWNLAKPVLVEKSPLNLIRTRFLQALFPQARFVLIVRHPVVVAYATRKWCDSPIPVLIDHSLRCYEGAFVDLPHLRHVHVIRYEDLVGAPQETLDGVLEFIAMPPLPVTGAAVRRFNRDYFAEWQAERAQITSGVEPTWLARTQARCRALGYSLDSPEPLAQANLEITSSA